MFFFVFFWILDNGIIGKRVKQVRHLYSGVELRIGHICLNICGDIDMSFCTLTLSYFCVSSLLGSVPNFTNQNPLVYRSLPYHPRNWIVYRFEFFWGAVKTQKLTQVPFLFELLVVVSWYAICHSCKPYTTDLLKNSLSTRINMKISLV